MVRCAEVIVPLVISLRTVPAWKPHIQGVLTVWLFALSLLGRPPPWTQCTPGIVSVKLPFDGSLFPRSRLCVNHVGDDGWIDSVGIRESPGI